MTARPDPVGVLRERLLKLADGAEAAWRGDRGAFVISPVSVALFREAAAALSALPAGGVEESSRTLFGCAYQLAGYHDAPEAWLDRLSDAMQGRPLPDSDTLIAQLLPYAPTTTPQPSAAENLIAAVPSDDELPGMWSGADLIGGKTDAVGAQRDRLRNVYLRDMEDALRQLHAIVGLESALASAPAGEAVAWTVIGPDGKSSIGGWHDMRLYSWSEQNATLREGHSYAFAYHPTPAADASEGEAVGYGVFAGGKLTEVAEDEDYAQLCADSEGDGFTVQPLYTRPAPVGDAKALLERAYEVVHHDIDCPAIGGNGDGDCRCDAVPFLRDLKARLATSAQPGDAGMVLVPREPTYQMAEAMGVKWESGEGFPRRYRAMLAAAPPQPERPASGECLHRKTSTDGIFTECDDCGATIPPNAAPVQADGREVDEAMAAKLYARHAGNHPTIHCNRFPPWQELSESYKQEWRDKAALAQQAHGGREESNA